MQIEKGKFLYRERGIATVAMIFVGISVLILIITPKEMVIESSMMGFMTLSFFIRGLMDLNREKYYEHGIMQYRLGKAGRFIPYEQIERVVCTHRSGKRASRYMYILCFYQKGKQVGRITTPSLEEIENLWVSIHEANPHINFLSKLTLSERASLSRGVLDALHMDEWETPGGVLFTRLKEISLEIKGCDNDIKS